MNTRFLISSNPHNLIQALQQPDERTATVEAEYGDVCVEGNIITMAHHGSRSGQPAPCSYKNGCAREIDLVGLSHLDLDSLGGCAAIIGAKPELQGFWGLAEFLDLNGEHKINQSGGNAENLRRFYAFKSWNDSNKIYPPRDGTVLDITDEVLDAVNVLTRIMDDDVELLKQGDLFKKAEEDLNLATFVDERDGVILRVATKFTNHLYTTPDGKIARAVVSFNTLQGSITVSFADTPTKGGAANDIVRELFGDEAGGHAGIAGSPRGKRMKLDDLTAAFEVVCRTF
jgi:hypothetical protein